MNKWQAYDFAVANGLIESDDNVRVSVFSTTRLDDITITDVGGLKVLHDRYDSVIRRDGRLIVSQRTENTDEFIYVGLGVIMQDW